jgi:hypothetical protein
VIETLGLEPGPYLVTGDTFMKSCYIRECKRPLYNKVISNKIVGSKAKIACVAGLGLNQPWPWAAKIREARHRKVENAGKKTTCHKTMTV